MKQAKMSMKYIWIIIAGCGLVASGVGLVTNVAGLFFTPIATEFGILKGEVSLTLTICNIVYAFAGMLTPRIVYRRNIKAIIIIGTILEVASTFVMSISPNVIWLYVANAIRGFAGGVLGLVLVTTFMNNWFHEKIGLVTSIAMSCSGLAGAIFSPIVSSVIQSTGWRTGYIVVAVLMLILNLPAVIFLPSLNPHEKGYQAYGETEVVEDSAIHVNENNAKPVNKILFIAVVLYAFMVAGATALPQFYPGIAETANLSETTGAMMLSLAMIANSGGKILLGILIDKIGAKLSILIYSALALLATACLIFGSSDLVMLIGGCLFGASYALATVAVVMITKDMFGIENYAKTYPTITLTGTLANAFLTTGIGFLYDASGNYNSTLYIMFGALIISIVLSLYCYRSKVSPKH